MTRKLHPCARTNATLRREIQESLETNKALAAWLGLNLKTVAKRGTALCSLHHVIDLDWMREAFRLTRKDGAPGIDGVTAEDYEANLEANLLDLLE